jgi:hypothetical protein
MFKTMAGRIVISCQFLSFELDGNLGHLGWIEVSVFGTYKW